MSVFGDAQYEMNQLLDEIELFFDSGGTISQFFKVLDWYFDNHSEFCEKSIKN